MTVAVGEPLHSLSSCLDSVRGSLSGLDDQGIVQVLRDVEELSRRTQSVMLDVVAEAETRGMAAREGFGTTQRLLAGMLRLSAAEARTRVEHAAAVGIRRTLAGEVLPPRLPETAAALAAGEIGAGQLRVITETMAALPASVRERAEADLAAHARDFDPRRLRIIAHRLLANLDPDGPEPADEPTPATPSRGELWLRAPGRGSCHAHRATGDPPRPGRPRPRLYFPRLPPPTQALRRPSRAALDRRR